VGEAEAAGAMKHIVCSPENLAHVTAQVGGITPEYRGFPLADVAGMPIVANAYCPTWQTFPRPKWWRRWFLREKQRPPERVFYVVDLGAEAFRFSIGDQVRGETDAITVARTNYDLGLMRLSLTTRRP
jgi:hypothetical protein